MFCGVLVVNNGASGCDLSSSARRNAQKKATDKDRTLWIWVSCTCRWPLMYVWLNSSTVLACDLKWIYAVCFNSTIPVCMLILFHLLHVSSFRSSGAYTSIRLCRRPIRFCTMTDLQRLQVTRTMPSRSSKP